MQKFKSVYFADHPGDSAGSRNVTLAFGSGDRDLYQRVRNLSSEEVRTLVGHGDFATLEAAANDRMVSLNRYCLRLIRSRLEQSDALSESQPPLPGFQDTRQDPLIATFRGGAGEPMHSWYPYLEGYSTRFVQAVLREFAPRAARVLDPFGGTGTTPLAAATLGQLGMYCEVNPLLQLLTRVKSDVLRMNQAQRRSLAEQLSSLAASFDWSSIAPDLDLRQTYLATFGASEYFRPDAFDAVLRCRAWLDLVAAQDPLLGRVTSIAAAASLVPSSELIRRGDLRFKRQGEGEGVELAVELRARLNGIATDLVGLGTIAVEPLFVTEDARSLALLPPLDLDAVVTSPPYLNGTNYFRNTKVELWFLRALQSPADLARYRTAAVTSGINDVAGGNRLPSVSPAVDTVVAQLAKSAYDKRIPRMAATYFEDMQEILRSVASHLRRNATVVIDIGDSAYAGVHVPTDVLVTEVAQQVGLELTRKVLLRRRRSRGGHELQQHLLVLRQRPRSESTARRRQPTWKKSWATFTATLPHRSPPMSKRNWGHELHSLCSYQGKLKPAIASSLIATFVPQGGRVLDPFAGVGTIPFEAALQGRKGIAFDISPAALIIARGKLQRTTKNEATAVIDDLVDALEGPDPSAREESSANAIRFNGRLADYFHPATMRQIILARRHFLTKSLDEPGVALVYASLLHILHGNRPYALSRRSHPITPFSPSGPTEARDLIPRLRAKVERSLASPLPEGFVDGDVCAQDATEWWPANASALDAVVTSPPFFDSTRFHLANWMRLWFAGWELEDFRLRPQAFVDERQKRGFDVYLPVIRQSRQRLRSGGVLVLHLGKSDKSDMAAEIARIARPWFGRSERFVESVAGVESHGITDKGRVDSHVYLVLY